MKRKTKDIVLGRLSQHLHRFYPELSNHFVCPTCFDAIPLSKSPQISRAHIIPEAAGGRLWTFLCSDCNKRFGAKQDKWFGEYLYLRQGNKDVLESRVRAGYFNIDGIRYGGEFTSNNESGLNFYINTAQTSPKALKELDRRLHAEGYDGAKLSIPIPLTAKRSFLNVGFLTAAYLLWFYRFGYSWALQKHLDVVRNQIRNPMEQVIHEKYVVKCEDLFFDPPWVGVIRFQGEIVLIAAIADSLVSLPAVDRPSWPFTDQGKSQGTFDTQYRQLDLYEEHQFDGPLAMFFENRLLIAPDVFLSRRVRPYAIWYPSWDWNKIPLQGEVR